MLLMGGGVVLRAVFAVVMVAEQVSAAGTRLFTTVLPILRGWLDDAAASHDALGQLLAGNPAIGLSLPSNHTLIPFMLCSVAFRSASVTGVVL